MGKLVDGTWKKQSVATTSKTGEYDRIPRSFLDEISEDSKKFTPERNRYHLYVSYACPWAHRTLIYRKLKSLEDIINVSVVSPDMLDEGWVFDDSYLGATNDHLYNLKYLRDIYIKADPTISTSVTVPILWDKKTETIVNNESSQIIRIFNKSFNKLTGHELDLSPEHLLNEIDSYNEKIYEPINNGVYKSGFAKTQDAYDQSVSKLFETLDWLEKDLEGKRFLVGDTLTEADIRLVTTLVRFDLVYYTHFKCNLKRIKDYKNLSNYTKNLYEIPEIKETTNFDHIKRHYYFSHESINPFQIIPKGPLEII
jgi:glutathionyl-hydroquinone reductase